MIDKGTRINKFLSKFGSFSRREADNLINQGRVTVNNRIAELGYSVSVNDIVIICTYGSYDESEAKLHQPTLVYFDKDNNVTNVKNKIPEQRLKSV